MACTPTRIELSNSASTTVEVTVASWGSGDPELSVTLEVDGLSIDETATTSSGVASIAIAAVSGANNAIYDATIQIGANRPAVAEVLVTETNVAQNVGITIDDSTVTYCAPSAGGGGTGTVTSVGLSVPGGFTVAGTNPITTAGTFEITSDLSGVIKGDGSATFSGSAELEDIADVEYGLFDLPSPFLGHVLQYDPSEGKWSNRPMRQTEILTNKSLHDNNDDVTIFGFGGTPYPANGQTLTWSSDLLQWTNLQLTIDADQITSGTIDTARIDLAIDNLSDCTIDKTADNILYTTGSAVRARAASNWSLSDFTADLDLNDLADVNVSQGAGNDGDLITYDHAAGAGAKFKGVARSSIGLSEFDNDLTESDLPAIQDSYLMLIESPSDKTYIIDGRVAAARTITNFYAKTSSGTCTATLKNVTDTTTIGTISVTSTGGSAASLSNTAVTENERLSIEISSNSSSEDLELVVEFTQ